MTVFLYAIEARDLIYDRLAELCGARLTSNYGRIGGVARDAPSWIEKTTVLDRVNGYVDEIADQLVSRSASSSIGTRGAGVVPRGRDRARLHGAVAPRAGEPYDVRKAAPYLVYDRLDFDIPVGTNGDNFDRFQMRMEEMRQSDRIIRQCFAQMEPGEIAVQDFRYVLPPKPSCTARSRASWPTSRSSWRRSRSPPARSTATRRPRTASSASTSSRTAAAPYKLGLRAPGWPMLACAAVHVGGLAPVRPRPDVRQHQHDRRRGRAVSLAGPGERTSMAEEKKPEAAAAAPPKPQARPRRRRRRTRAW